MINVSADVGAIIVTPAAMTCNGSALDAMSGFFAEAHPTAAGISGQRAFAIDSRGSIYANFSGVAIAPGMAGASPLQ